MILHSTHDAVIASLASMGATASVLTVNPEAGFAPLLVALIGPVLVLVANRVLSYKAARKRVLAAHYQTEGEKRLSDGNPLTDAEGRILLLQAAEIDAGADALDGVTRGPQ